jgi:anthranilate/para-aminobenzoate synthase component I
MAGADPLDVYRALRVQSAARFGFFMDFGDIPESFRTRVTGVSSTRMHRRLHGGAPASAWASMVAVQPSAALFGDPPALAARALREVEETSRTLWGDAFGYICPGGASEWFLAETCATIEEQSFVCATGARIDASTDPEAVPPETERGAAAALRALATAQANAPKPAPDKPA